jgi:hypothetical protein
MDKKTIDFLILICNDISHNSVAKRYGISLFYIVAPISFQ